MLAEPIEMYVCPCVAMLSPTTQPRTILLVGLLSLSMYKLALRTIIQSLVLPCCAMHGLMPYLLHAVQILL